MLRKSLTLVALFIGCGVTSQAQILETDFNSGIPAGFTLKCYDDMPVKTADFAGGLSVQQKWFGGKVDAARGNSALSTSHRQYDMKTDNWLITPQIEIPTDGTWLYWEARSMHYDLRDGYTVMVSTGDTRPASFAPVFSTEGENYVWTQRKVSLKAYAGKKVYVAFVHNAKNRFLLAIDNLSVGNSAPRFVATDRTKRTCGNESPVTPVEGVIDVHGAGCKVTSISCETAAGLLTQPVGKDMATGDTIAYKFELPVKVSTASTYKIMVNAEVGGEAKSYEVVSDSVICTIMPRRLLLEKCTAFWCSSCPAMNAYIYEMKARYGDRLVVLDVQFPAINGQDPAGLSYAHFVENLKTSNLPTVYYNRDVSAPQYYPKDVHVMENALKQACFASVDVTKAELSAGNKSIAGKVAVRFGADFDNSSDKYRVGFALKEKVVRYGYNYQANGTSGPGLGEFGFMASPVPADLMFYHNIVRGTETAFTGVAGSLPAQIGKGETYEVDYTFGIEPEKLYKIDDNLVVVCYLLDVTSGRVLNVAELDVTPAQSTGILKPAASEAGGRLTLQPGQCTVSFEHVGSVTLYDLSGRPLVTSAPALHHVLSTSFLPKGCYVVKMQSESGITSKRIVLE